MNILMAYHFSPHTTANYLARAFRALGHDVRTAGAMGDLGGWANPYRLWQHTDPLAQGQALELGDWEPDLAVWVESGAMDTIGLAEIHARGVPLAAWFIDSHNPGKLAWHQRLAPAFDYVFAAMTDGVEGLPNAHWLPLACDPEIHTPRVLPDEPAFDLAWVGGDYRTASLYAPRFAAMRELSKRYRCNFQSGVYFEDMADVYASARIGWHMSVTGRDLDMRPFEIMCSGRPLVADVALESGLWNLFSLTDLCMYGCEAEMISIIRALLHNPEWAQSYATAGRAAVLAAHTYQHRASELLEVCGA